MEEDTLVFRDLSCVFVDRLVWARTRSTKSHEATRKDHLDSQWRETLLQVVETVMLAYFSVRLRPKVKSTTPMALAITTTTMILAANIPGLSTFVIGIIV